eukprot:gnl/Trimastix_PCT/1881.p1 GENE.gnl/Trimastix_PCT/1881~~gnl/Trimastix_PCT/1881.p1  ORF type:complete len:596 (+),score=85.66 gnl/Trimastix_PCT/1881:58-1845(+)
MSLKSIYAPLPNTVRAEPCRISCNRDGRMVYCSGSNVVMRYIDNPMNVEVYGGHTATTTCAKWAPSGAYICSGDSTGKILMWDTLNEEGRILKLERKTFNGPVTDIAWTSDSQRIATVGQGTNCLADVFIWNTGASIGSISGHTRRVLTCDFRPTRPFRLVTGGEDNLVNFYQGPPFRFKHSYNGHSRYVNTIRYSPDGARYASVGSDKTIRLFEGKTGEFQHCIESPDMHKVSIYDLCWSPDGTQAVTCSGDKTCKMWDMNTGQCLQTFTPCEQPTVNDMQQGVIWTPQAIISVSLDGSFNFWDPTMQGPRHVIHGHHSPVNAVVHDMTAPRFYSADHQGNIRAFGDYTGNEEPIVGHTQAPITHLATTGDAVAAVSLDSKLHYAPLDTNQLGAGIDTVTHPNGIAVLNGLTIVGGERAIATYRDEDKLHEVALPFDSVCFAANGGRVAVGQGNKVMLFTVNFDNGELVQEGDMLTTEQPGVCCLGLSPDGRYLAVAMGKNISLYTLPERECVIRTWQFHDGTVHSMDWASDSKHLVSCGNGPNLILWDVEQHLKCTRIPHQHKGGAKCVRMAGDNVCLTAGPHGMIHHWDLEF